MRSLAAHEKNLSTPSYPPLSTAKQGDNALRSVRLFACLSVCMFVAKSEEESLPVQNVSLCVCNQWAYADNLAVAVDWLLIL